MTANAMEGDRERALAAGMNDHVSKPINVRVLFETLARWVVPSEPAPAPAIAPRSADAPTIELPPIEGIDLEEALARCHGNRSLLLRTLRRFRDRSASMLEDYDRALAAEDREAAVRTAHTLKGLAGTVGAGALAVVAQRLEKETEERGDVAETRASLGEALAALRVRLEVLGSEVQAEAPVEALDEEAAARLESVLASLRELLDESDAAAGDLLREHEGLLARGLSTKLRGRLASAIADWDFEAATALLDRAASEEQAAADGSGAATASERSDDADALLSELAVAVAENDVTAQEIVQRERDYLVQILGVHRVATLREALAEYDFERAEAELAAAVEPSDGTDTEDAS